MSKESGINWRNFAKKGAVGLGGALLAKYFLQNTATGQQLTDKVRNWIKEDLLDIHQEPPQVIILPVGVRGQPSVQIEHGNEMRLSTDQVVEMYHYCLTFYITEMCRDVMWLVWMTLLKNYEMTATDPEQKNEAEEAINLFRGIGKIKFTAEFAKDMLNSRPPFSEEQRKEDQEALSELLHDRFHEGGYYFPGDKRAFMEIWVAILDETGDLDPDRLLEAWESLTFKVWDQVMLSLGGRTPGSGTYEERVERANQYLEGLDPEKRGQLDQVVSFVVNEVARK